MKPAMAIKQYFSTEARPCGLVEIRDLLGAISREEYLNMAADCAKHLGVPLEVDDAKTPVVSR